MKKVKVFKNCINCSFKVKNLCKGNINNEFCLNWLPKQASCANCLRIRICLNENKDVSEKFICSDFERNKFPISIREVKEDIDLLKNEDDDEELYSPISSIENIITKDFHPSSFSKIDDSDISRAENDIDFILNPNFMGIELFPKQLVANMEFLGSNCPYCSDNKFIKKVEVDTPLDEILDRSVLYDKWGICPKCKKTRYDAYEDKKLRFYKDMIGICGQRSGKSTNTAILSALITYKYLMLADPCDFFPGILRGTTLHGTFVSLTFGQAFDNLWQPYYELLIGTKWFKEYTSFLMEAGEKAGRELVKIRDTFVIFHTKGLTVYPSGPDKRKLRGRCLPGYTKINTSKGLIRIDEIGNFLNCNTIRGKNKRKIIDFVDQGNKKVYRIKLNNGIELDATFDHRVPILTKKLKRKLIHHKDLKGKYVFCQLKGGFPKKLEFDHNIKLHTPTYIKIARYIANGKIFTIDDLSEKYNLHKNSVLSYHLGPMIKARVLSKKMNRGYRGIPLPSDYWVNDNFRLKDWDKLREGSINNNRKDVTIPNKMTPKLARFIGYLIADGDLSFSGEAISYCTTSKSKYKDFNKLFVDLFNCKPCLHKEIDGYGLNKDKPCYYTTFSYNSIKEFIIYIGLSYVNAHTKTLPWCILQAPRKCVIECISAMISCDGGIVNKSYLIGVYYSTKSEELAKDLQLLIMKLGYVCNRKKGYVYLPRKSSIDFLNEYTGLNKRDYKNDSKILLSHHKRSYSQYLIPYSKSYVLSELNEKFNIKPNKREQRFQDKNLIFSKVKSVEYIGRLKVYDVSVDSKDHLFPANNILVHNTRFLSSIDELSWFWGTEKAIKYDPDEIYEALDNSLMTVYAGSKRVFPKHPYTPTAYGIYISSPSSKTDKGMRMLQLSKSSKSIYGFTSSTWNFNPNITREDLADKFSSDPVKAERDFGANPPHSSSPFISSPAMIIPSFSNKRNLLGLDQHRIIRDSLGGKLLAPKVIIRNTHTFPSILGIDSGWNNNSFACVLQHYLDEERTRIGVSGIIEMMPTSYPLSFPDIYEDVISPIIENFNISIVVADRWQSIDLTQRIYQDYEIDALMYTIKYPDFEYIRSKILSEDFKFPRLERKLKDLISVKRSISDLIVNSPVSHLFLQMLMVNDTGRTVTKGDECTDDVFRAFAIGSSILLDPEYEDLFGGGGKENSYQVSNMIVVANKSMPFQQGMSQGQSQAPSGIGVVSGKSSNFQQGSMGALGGR